MIDHARRERQKLGKRFRIIAPVPRENSSVLAVFFGDLDKSGVAELTFPGRHANPGKPKAKAKGKAKGKPKKKKKS